MYQTIAIVNLLGDFVKTNFPELAPHPFRLHLLGDQFFVLATAFAERTSLSRLSGRIRA